jgi:PRTRC genetic system ThiF family protein
MYSVNSYIANPTHNLKVDIIGVGGTGSQVLPELVALSQSLVSLGRKPLEIRVFDNDKIESHNVGRQKFFPCDVGQYKAETLVHRVNRAYGSNVAYYNRKWDPEITGNKPNIIITCVDNVKTRKKVNNAIYNIINFNGRTQYNTCYHWIDSGNSKDFGQVILSSHRDTEGEAYTPIITDLPTVIDLHPDMEEQPNEPSCSLRASLMQQSFMINKLTSVYVMELMASMLLDLNFKQSQIYFSLNPINVKTNKL